MGKKQQTCKNCEKQFNDTFQFCPHCGQQAKDDLTVGVLFYNTISNYFSFDARFFKSFLPLMFKPGFLAKRFIEGKRLLYLHPAQLYLFISVIFFFVFSFVQREQVRALDETFASSLKKDKIIDAISSELIIDSLHASKLLEYKIDDSLARAKNLKSLENNKMIYGISERQIDSLLVVEDLKKNSNLNFDLVEKVVAIDSLIEIDAHDNILLKEMGLEASAGAFERRFYKQALKFYKSRKGGSILQAFYDTIPVAMFFLLPIFALFLKFFYRNCGSYAHHLVFSFYYFSFIFTVFSIIISVNFIYDIPNGIDFLMTLSTFIYLLIALHVFYKQGRFKTFFKGSMVTFLFLSVVAPLTAFILGMFAFLFY